jgi:benzylsuccinate CoA-transferase BbsE subunit
VDVSTQESVALALEDSLAEFALNRRVRTRLGESPREAGTGTYRCADGHVTMVAGRLSTGRAWGALVQWLAEERAEGAERLLTPEWQRFEHRRTPAAREAFRAIFETFAAGRTKEELYREGQRRSIAIAPVNTVAEVLADPQLEAREAFVQVEQPELGRSLSFPVPPYRLSRTPARITGPAPALGQHNAELLREVA